MAYTSIYYDSPSICEIIVNNLLCNKDPAVITQELSNELFLEYKQCLSQCGRQPETSDELTLIQHIESKDYLSVFSMFDFEYLDISLLNQWLSGLEKVKVYHYYQECIESTEVSYTDVTKLFIDIVHSMTPTDRELQAMYRSILMIDIPHKKHTLSPCQFQCMRNILKSVIETHDKHCWKLFTVNVFSAPYSTFDEKEMDENVCSCEDVYTIYCVLHAADVLISHKSFGNTLSNCTILIQLLININRYAKRIGSIHLCHISTTLMKKVLDSSNCNLLTGLCKFYDDYGPMYKIRSSFQECVTFDFAVLLIRDLIRKNCFETLVNLFGDCIFTNKLCVPISEFKGKSDDQTEELLTADKTIREAIYEEFADLMKERSNVVAPCDFAKEIWTHCDPNAPDKNNCVPLQVIIFKKTWAVYFKGNVAAPIVELMRCTKPNVEIVTTIEKHCVELSRRNKQDLNPEFLKTLIQIMDSDCEILFQMKEGRSLIHDAIVDRSLLFLKVVTEHLTNHSKHVNSVVCDIPAVRAQDKHTLLIGVLKSIKLRGKTLILLNPEDKTNENIIVSYEELLQNIITIPDIDIEARDELQWTAAYHAAMTLNPNIVGIIVEDGNAKVNVKNRYEQDIISAFTQMEGTISGQEEKMIYIDILSRLKHKKVVEVGESLNYEDGDRPVTQEIIENQFQRLKSLVNSYDGMTEDQQQCVLDFVESAEITMKHQRHLRNDGPMSEEHRKKLRAKWSYLCGEIDQPITLCDSFISEDVLTLDIVDYIGTFRGRRDRCRHLLTILYYRCSDRAFQVFCDALRKTRQGHIADELEKDIKYFEETTNSMTSQAVLYPGPVYPQQFVNNPYPMPTPAANWASNLNFPSVPALLPSERPVRFSNYTPARQYHPHLISTSASPSTSFLQRSKQKEPISVFSRQLERDDTFPKVISVADDTQSSTNYMIELTVPKTSNTSENQPVMVSSENSQDDDETRPAVIYHKEQTTKSSDNDDGPLNKKMKLDIKTADKAYNLTTELSINDQTNAKGLENSPKPVFESMVGQTDGGSLQENEELVSEKTDQSNG